MPNKLKLRQLEGFVAAADGGSFIAGASAMAMTAPAFSQLIRELESSLGLVLFERTTRRVELTDAGRRLLDQVRRPLADLAEVSADMKALAGGLRGRVVISILHSLAQGVGARAVAQLRQLRPDITVRIIEDQNEIMIERVRNREVDFGLGMINETYDDLSFSFLFEDELVAVFASSNGISRSNRVTWRQLAMEDLILLQPKSSVRRLVEAGLLVTGLTPKPFTEVVSMVTAMNMASLGLGVAVLPEISLASMRISGVTIRPIGDPRPRRKIGFVRLKSRPTSPAEALFAVEIAKAASTVLL